MPIRIHEIHPALVHLPLGLVPLSATAETLAYLTCNKRIDAAARVLWIAATSSAVVTGIAGFATSQEAPVPHEKARDQMFLHAVGNIGITSCALGLTAWRLGHRASFATMALGLVGSLGAMYTGYLGGRLVYEHGVGVVNSPTGKDLEAASPPLSLKAMRQYFYDIGRGAGWVFRQLFRVTTGKERLMPGAAGIEMPPMAGRDIGPEVHRPPPM